MWVNVLYFRSCISENILEATAENFRKLRNTARFMLGNLYGFDPSQAVPLDEMMQVTY